MLRLTPFTYRPATSLTEALALRSEHSEGATLMGGGTDLLPNIKHRLASPDLVIGLRSVEEMQGIHECEDGGLRLGAAVPLWEVEHSPDVLKRYPALAHAASLIS